MIDSKRAYVAVAVGIVLLSVIGGGGTRNDDGYLWDWFVGVLTSGDLVGTVTSGAIIVGALAFVYRDRIEFKGFGSDDGN